VRASLATLSVLAVAASACGGDKAAAVTKEAYLAEANPICADANDRALRLADSTWPATRPPTLEETIAYFSEFRPIVGEALEDLRAVEPPPRDRALIQRILAGFARAHDEFGKIEDAARERDGRRFDASWDAAAQAARAAQYDAAVYGLHACANFAWVKRSAI